MKVQPTIECKNCVFFRANGWPVQEAEGYCHRYPAAVPAGPDEFSPDRFPKVLGRDWCGEFAPGKYKDLHF